MKLKTENVASFYREIKIRRVFLLLHF
jgi:hypothetical protein